MPRASGTSATMKNHDSAGTSSHTPDPQYSSNAPPTARRPIERRSDTLLPAPLSFRTTVRSLQPAAIIRTG
jgi:hypothetical protein